MELSSQNAEAAQGSLVLSPLHTDSFQDARQPARCNPCRHSQVAEPRVREPPLIPSLLPLGWLRGSVPTSCGNSNEMMGVTMAKETYMQHKMRFG